MLVPLSRSAAHSLAGTVTHPVFWRLPEKERRLREQEFQALRSGYRNPDHKTSELPQYEAQQPPLYYLLLSIPYALVSGLSLPARILALRLVSVCLTVPALLFCYGIARRLSASRQVALLVPVLLALFPGLFIDVCRVGNDCLAVTFGAAAVYCAVRLMRDGAVLRGWVLLGIVLVLALLTKAYFVALAPLVPLLGAAEIIRRRSRARQTLARCAVAFLIVLLGAGWWYWRTWAETATLSGEQLDAVAASAGLQGKLAAIRGIHWFRVLDAAAATHLWGGGWSFLRISLWIHRVFKLTALIALVGGVVLAARWGLRGIRRRRVDSGGTRFAVVAAAWLLAWCIVGYDTLIFYILSGESTTVGWYSYGALGAEAALFAAGFAGAAGLRRAARCLTAVAILHLALDFYTLQFVSIPHYTGLAPADSGIGEICARLSVAKASGIGPAVVAVAWGAYLFASAALAIYALMWWRRRTASTPIDTTA